jgi:hypothetical protein
MWKIGILRIFEGISLDSHCLPGSSADSGPFRIKNSIRMKIGAKSALHQVEISCCLDSKQKVARSE